MTAIERRKKMIELMRQATGPISGKKLGSETEVSRQVVVQDIAILRNEGFPILATARGYLLNEPKQVTRIVKVRHTNEQTEEELNLIVDLGGAVVDVMVNHRIYGKLAAPLGIKSRRDVQSFMQGIRAGKSVPLMNVTSGYHYHTLAAENEQILDEIEEALREKKFTAELLPYEKDFLLNY